MTRIERGWSDPQFVAASVNADAHEYFRSVTDDNNPYFSRSKKNGVARICRAKCGNDRYAEPEMVPLAVPGKAMLFNTFISQRADFLITYALNIDSTNTDQDYCVSFKSSGGEWGEPIRSGRERDTPGGNANSAYISPDGKHLFFSSSGKDSSKLEIRSASILRAITDSKAVPGYGSSAIYWDSAKVIQALKPKGWKQELGGVRQHSTRRHHAWEHSFLSVHNGNPEIRPSGRFPFGRRWLFLPRGSAANLENDSQSFMRMTLHDVTHEKRRRNSERKKGLTSSGNILTCVPTVTSIPPIVSIVTNRCPMTHSSDLVDLFLHLACIEGISLHERAIANSVAILLTGAGIRVVEDGSAKTFGGTTGNLLCFPPDYRSDQPALMLTAHLDTVKSTASLKPIVDSTAIRSDGTTILGADNRLGLSVLVRLLTDVANGRSPHNNFFVVFTVGEETGLFGAGSIDVSPYKASCAYVFDCSKRPGVYIRDSVGLYAFEAEFIGKAAHSGVSPEKGISAIMLASTAIAKLTLGRIDADTTANVGKIHGGEAINSIPERVTIEGEVRSFTRQRIQQQLDVIEQSLRASVDGTGKLTFKSKSDFEPYVLATDAPMIVALESAMRSVGLKPEPIRYTGGSDANKYNAKGIPAVNLGIGAQNPHSYEEFVLIEDLLKTYELARALVSPHD